LPDTHILSFIEKLLPAPLMASLAALLLAISVLPTIRELLKDAFPSQRQFRREKQKLELLKLMYEVEAIKKQHDLGELATRLPQSLQSGEIARQIQGVTVSTEKKPMSLPRRLLFGSFGSFVLWGVTVVYYVYDVRPSSLYLTDVALFVVLTGLGGVASWLLRSRSAAWSLLHGMTPAFLLILLGLVMRSRNAMLM